MKTALAILILATALAGQTDREVTEFTIFKRGDPVKILPGVDISLKSVNVGKQRYSIELFIEGHKIEKKDLNIMVPLFFYVGTDTLSHELVVTKVGADQIVGRLSSPKE
jgi:hypothetical protein